MMDQETDEWKETVRQKLIVSLDNESLVRVLLYLTQEENTYNRERINEVPPVWRTLRALVNADKAFDMYAKRLVEDTKRAENDPEFRATLGEIYAAMMTPSDEPLEDEELQGFELSQSIKEGNLALINGFMSFSHSWGLIPLARRGEILKIIPKIIRNRSLVISLDNVVGMANNYGGTIVMVGLATVYLGYQAIISIRQWYRGEITGIRCSKNIIDATVSMAAGVGGGIGGAALGGFLGPIGAIVGGVAGGIVSSHVANLLCDRLTQSIFGLPKDVAVENAYKFLGVPMTASNSEVNTAFRTLCLQHHPDKGGKTDDFLVVQLHMSIIREARQNN